MAQKTIEATNYQNVDIIINRNTWSQSAMLKWTNPDLAGFKIISSQLTGTIEVGANSTATINGQSFQGPYWGTSESHQFNFVFTIAISEIEIQAQSQAYQNQHIRTSNVKYTITYDDGGVIKKATIYLGGKTVNKLCIGDTPIKKVYLGEKMIYEI